MRQEDFNDPLPGPGEMGLPMGGMPAQPRDPAVNQALEDIQADWDEPEDVEPPAEPTPQERVHERAAMRREQRKARLGKPFDPGVLSYDPKRDPEAVEKIEDAQPPPQEPGDKPPFGAADPDAPPKPEQGGEQGELMQMLREVLETVKAIHERLDEDGGGKWV